MIFSLKIIKTAKICKYGSSQSTNSKKSFVKQIQKFLIQGNLLYVKSIRSNISYVEMKIVGSLRKYERIVHHVLRYS